MINDGTFVGIISSPSNIFFHRIFETFMRKNLFDAVVYIVSFIQIIVFLLESNVLLSSV